MSVKISIGPHLNLNCKLSVTAHLEQCWYTTLRLTHFIVRFIYYFLSFLVSYYPHVLSIWRKEVLYIIAKSQLRKSVVEKFAIKLLLQVSTGRSRRWGDERHQWVDVGDRSRRQATSLSCLDIKSTHLWTRIRLFDVALSRRRYQCAQLFWAEGASMGWVVVGHLGRLVTVAIYRLTELSISGQVAISWNRTCDGPV